MKRRIIAVLLCVCIAMTGFVYASADGEPTGDANGDKKVTPADAAFVLRYCRGMENARMKTRNKMLADVDCDGVVETADAADILRIITGLKSPKLTGTDLKLFANLKKQSQFDNDMTEWIARYIQAMPSNSGRRKVLYAGAKYMGLPYGTGNGQMDCSMFVRTAFRDAGYDDKVYPGGGSEKVRSTFERAGKLKTVRYAQGHEGDIQYLNTKEWKPGFVLIYLTADPNTGEAVTPEKANHVALYAGMVDGKPIIMESGTKSGVRLTEVWSYGQWKLAYYVDPLG